MKKILVLIAMYVGFNIQLIAQTPFTLATFETFNKNLKANPVEVVSKGTHKNFTFINGNGAMVGYKDLLGFYSYYTETVRETTALKISQVNQTATVTGKVQHEWQAKSNPKDASKYAGMFTYTYGFDKGKWLLVSAQHTDIARTKQEDEVAIKKVIEEETQAYIDGDGKKLLSYWADKKTNESASQYLVPILGQPFAKGESMEKLQTVVVPNLKKQNFTVERSDFEVRINKNMAWATYTQKAIANGATLQTDRETRILEHINGDWKIVYVGEQGMK